MIVTLSGCQSTDPMQGMLWVRTDGRSMQSDPKLRLQGEQDRTICSGRVNQSVAGQTPVYSSGLIPAIQAQQVLNDRRDSFGEIMAGCMAERGYVLVPQAEAAARAAELRKISR
ncbi:hypothetical protein [Aureimonas frigidaquae]|uniref:hypothetical protein n=1 Tax=Aureimonas frigidaquae TaxID=424757 RepID=UPI0012EE3EBD|nr:hypothetical protein [Aureimonas frigidaquae]